MKITKRQKENIKIIQEYNKEMKSLGRCFQCQHPWHDGLCECDHILNDDEQKDNEEISKTAYELINHKIDIDKYIKGK